MKSRILLFSLFLGLLAAAFPLCSQTIPPLRGETEKRPSFSVTRVGHGRPMILISGMITDPKNVEAATAWSTVSDPAATGEAVYELMSTDLRETVAAIKTPVLLIGAAGFAKDETARRQTATAYEAQVAKVPHHKVVLAGQARHFIMLDDPAFLFSTMDAFLREVKP
jgi:pimeloyl-ACP methyl ester carboxylesterase